MPGHDLGNDAYVTAAQPQKWFGRPTIVMTQEKNENITPTKIVASTLAAVTAAVLSLRMGVMGTVIGAVVASVITTVGAVLYQRSMEREKRWQAVAVGGLLVLTITMLTVTSVQLVHGTPVGADTKPTETQKVVERSTETIKETVQPTTTTQSPAESTTTTGPSTSSTTPSAPSSSSGPSSTVDTIR